MPSLYRKFARESVRSAAEKAGQKPSAAVHRWRIITRSYPLFHGSHKPSHRQPILVYPIDHRRKSDLWRFM